ncbi:hypothetical protein [Actinophytocola sp.]|uniref:hypothetical protein n=1 Tax=Actinophytocola sp. TaxID=1872138 RepID=UPI002D802770|nr:hypothetical protein [Actinophytocola sp.]HET9143068.1 hypothetical protein [Actinophytocola sp.]
MIDNESMRQALGALERHAPDEADVLAGMRAGIVRRRRRRQVASVAGVAGVAGLVALGAVALAPGRDAEPAGPGPVVAASAPVSTVIAAPPPGPALPFTPGWLPDGYQLESWMVTPTEAGVQYLGNADFEVVVVELSDQPRENYPLLSDQPVTIAGRPGRIVRVAPDPAEQQILWQVADGRWAMVGGRAPQVTEAELRRVAENLSLRPTPLSPGTGLSLRALPQGYVLNHWNGAGGEIMAGQLCRQVVSLRSAEQPGDCIGFAVKAGTAPAGTQRKTGSKGQIVDVPVDRAEVVDGVLTRANADGTIVFAQIDPGHWVSVGTQTASVELLRAVAVAAVVR